MLPETQSKRTFVFRKYYEKYKHLWILLYFFVYMAWFNYVEKTVTTHFHVIHVPIDDYIPFGNDPPLHGPDNPLSSLICSGFLLSDGASPIWHYIIKQITINCVRFCLLE